MSYEKNLEYARAAIAEARTYMSFGHDNYEPRPSFREGCVDRSRDAVRAIIDRRAAADRSYLSGERRERLRVRESARRAMRSGCGNCYEQASLAYTYLEKQGIRPIDLFQLKALDHVFVVIGRTGDTPAKVSSWGAGAVVCDPWAPEGRRVFRALPMEQNFCRTLATRPETAPYHPPSGHASGDAHFEVELLISDLAKKAGVIAAPQPPPRPIQERATRP
jgi:hypothetical protein